MNTHLSTALTTALTLASVLGTGIVHPSILAQVPMQQQVEEVASYLVGVMTTTEQSKSNPNSPDVQMTTCQIEVQNLEAAMQRPQAIFLYQEQALSKKLSEPYRQRFLRLSASGDQQSVESATFKPKNSETWIGFCNKPTSERIVPSSEMGAAECSVFLKPMGNQYHGETQPGGCPINYRGAVRLTNIINLDAGGMDTLDRGFDAQGNQVWGARNQPYQFRRMPSSR